ncbi:hypothetical protein SDC9_163165 [bioreactor metagenome]|uniref:Uncharacterized protein n=1 Tax=bioreactor metagenome TaxID=1076179 RepID=A0A645FR06_9ZZZZ
MGGFYSFRDHNAADTRQQTDVIIQDNKNEKSSDNWEKKLGSGSVFSDRMNKVIKTFNNQLHNILDTCGAIGLF